MVAPTRSFHLELLPPLGAPLLSQVHSRTAWLCHHLLPRNTQNLPGLRPSFQGFLWPRKAPLPRLRCNIRLDRLALTAGMLLALHRIHIGASWHQHLKRQP